jgi:hypothetical protein
MQSSVTAVPQRQFQRQARIDYSGVLDRHAQGIRRLVSGKNPHTWSAITDLISKMEGVKVYQNKLKETYLKWLGGVKGEKKIHRRAPTA